MTSGSNDDRAQEPTVEELRLELARAQEQLAAGEREREGLGRRFDRLTEKYDVLQDEYSRQQVEVGRLRQVETTSSGLSQERDELRRELDQTHAAIPEQVRSQLEGVLGDVTRTHAEQVDALRVDRDRLQARVTELEQTAQAGAGPAMTTTHLAGHFADVLNDLGSRPASGGGFAAALTGLNVQAKGLLRTNEQGDVEILTAQAGAAPADQLSTVSLELRLLPGLPGTTPDPPR